MITQSTVPPTNAERIGAWYGKAARIGYLLTGPLPQRQPQALPSPRCPGSGRPGVVALDSETHAEDIA